MKKYIFAFIVILSVGVNASISGVLVMDRDSGSYMDMHDGAPITIDYAHEKIHSGKTYRVCTINYSVANNGVLDLLIGPGEEIHLTGLVTAEGKSYVYFYRNPTFSGGTAATVINMRDIDPLSCSNCAVTINPTVTNVGTELQCALLVGGTGPQSVGSEVRQSTEWNLDPRNKYLLRLKNVSGLAKDLNVNMQWYQDEEE